MKGGRTAPRNEMSELGHQLNVRHFNEGGADCPPKLLAEYRC